MINCFKCPINVTPSDNTVRQMSDGDGGDI
jgi:hypothetical protein